MSNKSLLMALLTLNSAHADTTNLPAITPKNQSASELVIEISNIKSMTGNINIAVFDNNNSWLTNAAYSTVLTIDKKHCQQSTCRWLVGEIQNGSYGVAVFHDVNSDGKMEYSFLGIPQEDYGFSNNKTSLFGLPPTWDKANFSIKNQIITHKINLK